MGRWSELADDLDRQYRDLIDGAVDLINKELDIADRDGYTEYGAVEQQKIKEIFRKAVYDWYGAYTPTQYQRRYDMYDVLDEKTDEYGMAITEASGYVDMFDERKMGPDRHGNSLFDKVFMEGWHGGAEGIDGSKAGTWGSHPSPGTPYYRKGGLIPLVNGRLIWHKYGKWGRKAVKTTSPASMFAERFSEADAGELEDAFINIMDKHYDKAEERIQTGLDALSDRIFG